MTVDPRVRVIALKAAALKDAPPPTTREQIDQRRALVEDLRRQLRDIQSGR